MDTTTLLPDCLLRARLQNLTDVYRKADQAAAAFASSAGLGCPFGCGDCCEGFMPDILPLEAAMVALEIAVRDRPLAHRLAAETLAAQTHPDGRQGCPLYTVDTPYHCSVYQARPLICRMFPFATVRDKLGQVAFSPCRLMPAGLPDLPTEVSLPPVMADFGYRLLMIDPDRSNQRQSLHQLLPGALSEVLFLIGLDNDHSPDSNDPGFTPLPQRHP